MVQSQESFMFTVGKLGAGMAILLGERAHLIEFPSLLLPPGATTGSIVNISVTQNIAEEKKRESDFWALQEDILNTYGTSSPEPPKLELRNVTQTSVTLEWAPLQLANAQLRSLDIYRNRQRLAAIPSPRSNTSTKLSGLSLDSEYTFQLVLRTSAGVFPSNLLRIRTHTMTDTSGVSVCFGTVQDPDLLEAAKNALSEMGAKWSDRIQIDTTHFVCTTPAATPSGAEASGSLTTAPGVEYQKALHLSIPVVQPQWILACHTEHRMVPIHPYYLGASPAPPVHSGSYARPQSMSQAGPARSPPASAQQKAASRQSLPPPASPAASPPSSAKPARAAPPMAPTPEEGAEGAGHTPGHVRKGTMSKTFRFPPDGAPDPRPADEAAAPAVPPADERPADAPGVKEEPVEAALPAPPTVEVPPPPPVDKEPHPSPSAQELADEEVGETEEVDLS
ncbi:hypothetical protein OBBRIDRAFT_819499 [Obba rivulosa]|uniref:Uncharacterized protein n=1 Tax=Obba rivulosa TaxID=1052685 RepID=A0A8E2DNJ4_9APHY|nr:hypothetical protein OBBRIDRAFT_819499 [Obba rivulosa]